MRYNFSPLAAFAFSGFLLSACQMRTAPQAPPPLAPDSKPYTQDIPKPLALEKLDWHLIQPVKTAEVAQWCLSNTGDHMRGAGGTVSGNVWNGQQKEDYFCAVPLVGSAEYQAVVIKFQPLSDKKGYYQADLNHLPAMAHNGFLFTEISAETFRKELLKNERFKHTVLWSENRAPSPYPSPAYWPCYVGWPFGMTQPASPICHPDLQNRLLLQSQVRY